MGRADKFLRLLDEGKTAEARAMIEEERAKAEFEPDNFMRERGGRVVPTHRGREVVLSKDGNWKLKNPPRRKRKERTGKP